MVKCSCKIAKTEFQILENVRMVVDCNVTTKVLKVSKSVEAKSSTSTSLVLVLVYIDHFPDQRTIEEEITDEGNIDIIIIISNESDEGYVREEG